MRIKQTTSRKISFGIPVDLYRKVKKIKSESGIGISELARRGIKSEVDRRLKKKRGQ